ncbi:MAG: hypothetical protein WCH43_11260 [Verrucomicrobiota bacterium]
MSDQLSLDFSGGDQPLAKSLEAWRADRIESVRRLAHLQGLPIGQSVRVDFDNGPSLNGKLLLDEESLFLPTRKNPHIALRIGNATFHADEIVSCARLD